MKGEASFQQENVYYRIISPSKRSIRLTISFPVKLAMHRVDLFLCQYMGPLFARCPYIVTIHDIIHERYPEFYPRNLRILMKLFYPLSARRAKIILTGSEYSKNEIRDIYKIPEEKIKVIPYGVSDDFRVVGDIDGVNKVKKKYGIDGNYILFVGRLEPRKNIKGLIDAYILLKNRYNIKQQLVIVGMKDALFRDFDIRGENIEGNVIFTGGVAQEDLPHIYNGADLFAYPSFAEGFGLPVLEAMACGVPTVTSRTSSLPEVVGDAGVMVDPGDEEDLANGIHKVLTEPGLYTRMKEKGLERSRLFTWKATAELVLQVFREIFAN
jgi:glycosyltransferase involved in cell wall biosynthesis